MPPNPDQPAPVPALTWLAPLLLGVLLLGGWLLWQRYGLGLTLLLNDAWLWVCG
ncbi:MAG: hypothetical protein HC911_14050 [Chloroflexaceae bacterium]|nr:hypothetical protein [Chloroflexaceae bacterium]